MADPIFPATWEIPTDYTIRKCRVGVKDRDFKVYDAYDNLLYRVQSRSFVSSARRVLTVLDAANSPIITAVHLHDGWQGFRGYSWEPNDLLFTVHKLAYSRCRAELEIYLSGGKLEDQKPKFNLKGSPFQRSCTIYFGDSIVAQHNAGALWKQLISNLPCFQANPLYKLRKYFYSRSKFRLTVYPENDHALAIAMLVTFFGGN